MSRQPRPIAEILNERLETVARIAAQNAEHLRLLQFAGGLEIHRLRAERDGEDVPEEHGPAETDAAVTRSQERLDALEAELDRIDRELAEATNPGTTN
ncbi:MAG: hypothetical protein KDA73_14450 [Rhodobacteraceae bacterium]|nr:hypothetical protein [Paracoccaceae bacterium]